MLLIQLFITLTTLGLSAEEEDTFESDKDSNEHVEDTIMARVSIMPLMMALATCAIYRAIPKAVFKPLAADPDCCKSGLHAQAVYLLLNTLKIVQTNCKNGFIPRGL